MVTIAVADVIVDGRARKDIGDLTPLKKSISELGLLQPIGLAKEGNHLVFGARRLEACRQLGMTEIPYVRLQDRDDAIARHKAELDENICRKAMSPLEVVTLGLRIEELERPAALERKRDGGRKGSKAAGHDPSNRTIGSNRKRGIEVSEIVADALGLSQATYKRLKTVVTAAESETDDVVRALAQEQIGKLERGETKPWHASETLRLARSNGNGTNGEEAEPPAPVVIPDLPTKTHGPRVNHLKILTKVVTGLSGTAMVLDEIDEINDSVNAEEARRLASDLDRQIRSLNRIRNMLKKERTN